MSEQTEIRVLVLDDELFMLKLHAQMLMNLGFTRVSTAQSGHAALAEMSGGSEPPDLILLDLSMPAMDGLEFIRRLVDRNFLGRLILVSGEDERVLRTVEKLADAHHIRVLGHLSKPVQEDKLATLLRRWRPPSGTFEIAWKKIYSEEALKQALDEGQLTVHYEPKVAIRTGELMGVEALVRWRHPTDGLVIPQQFVSVAESSGLIHRLTRVVLTEAMGQVAAWRSAGLVLKMAVNVSIDALSSLDFADFAAEQAAKASVPAKDVTIEVTESRLMQDLRAPLEVLTRLHLMRFQLAIDDFGTGYSSLSQLQDIPFSELKIDRSFVHRGGSDQTVHTMYNTCLGLARQLGMSAVAEGVEDKSDWDFVRTTDCETAQGYFIGRAMPPETLPGWSAKWRNRIERGYPEAD